MTSDKRIKQFFQLTEANIVGIGSDNRDKLESVMVSASLVSSCEQRSKSLFKDAETMSEADKLIEPIKKRTLLRLVLVILLIGSSFFYIVYPNGFIPTQFVAERNAPVTSALNKIKSPLSKIEPKLHSEIPAFYVAAIRQALQSNFLRKSEWVAANEQANESDLSLVVLDKVIVIPTIHPLKDKKIT